MFLNDYCYELAKRCYVLIIIVKLVETMNTDTVSLTIVLSTINIILDKSFEKSSHKKYSDLMMRFILHINIYHESAVLKALQHMRGSEQYSRRNQEVERTASIFPYLFSFLL